MTAGCGPATSKLLSPELCVCVGAIVCCVHLSTRHFWLLPLIAGMVCLRMSPLHHLYQCPEHVWRPTSSHCPCTLNGLPQHQQIISVPLLSVLLPWTVYLNSNRSPWHHLYQCPEHVWRPICSHCPRTLNSLPQHQQIISVPLLSVLVPWTVYLNSNRSPRHPLYQSSEHVWRPACTHFPFIEFYAVPAGLGFCWQKPAFARHEVSTGLNQLKLV